MKNSNWKKHAVPMITLFLKQNVHVNKLKSLLCFDMTKAEILKCPNKFYDGKIFIISSIKDEKKPNVQKALETLKKSNIIGFDTETAVFFNENNNNNPIALVQLATEDTVILWRLRQNRKYLRNEFPSSLKSLLKDNSIRKVGTGNSRDLTDLDTQYNIAVNNVVDNQMLAKDIGLIRVGLVSLTAQLFGWSISKNRRLSNWEAFNLDHPQLIYAATDAWASLLVYKKLESILSTLANKSPEPLPSSFENMLEKETQLDTKLFRSLDSKLLGDLLPNRTVQSFLQHKHGRLKKRKSQKVNLSVHDLDIDYMTDMYKQIKTDCAISDCLDKEESKSDRRRFSFPYYNVCHPYQIPFLYQSVVK